MLSGLQSYVLDILNTYAIMRHRTPEEHCASAWWNSSRSSLPRHASAPCMHLMNSMESSNDLSCLPHLSANHVRVKFFLDPTYQKIMDQCCVYADFPLDVDGGLDFETIRGQWGLSRCLILRYREVEGMRTFSPRSQYKLLSKEVRVMRGYDECISIIEEPHEARADARARRIKWLDRLNSLREEFHGMRSSLHILAALIALAILAWSWLGWHAYIALVMSEMALVYELPQMASRSL